MMRVVLNCLFLSFWLTTAAQAEPISLAILGALSITATATSIAVTNFIVGAVLSIGANLIASSLLAPDEAPRAALTGVSADVKFGGKIAHEGAFGLVATKGQYIYWNTYGAANRYLDQVYVLSSGWCHSLDGLFVDGKSVTLTETDSGTGWTKYAVELPDDGGTRRMWVTFWEGRHDHDASPVLIANANPSDRWTDAHILRGMAYAHVEADYKADMESMRSLLGGNALLFVVKGLRLYDPRKDSTAGGSGAHRFDDWTTWEWSDRPAVCQYHFERGYFINGVRVLGMGVPAYDLITPLYMAAANICDETVDTPDEGSEPRYRVALIVNDDAEYIDAVDSFVSAMAGQRVEREGMFGVIAGAAQMPVAAITDDDLLLDAPLVYTTRRRRDELINEIHGQYTDPENLWDGSSIEPVIGDAGVKAADGGETRPVPKNVYQVTSGFQARRLLLVAFRLNRMQATASFSLGEEALEYELGDWITWRSRTWMISGWRLETETDRVALTLQETASSVYSVGEGDVGPVPLPPTPPANPNRPTNISGLVLQQTTIEGADGQAIPALLVSWDAVVDETIRTVEIDYRVATEDDSGAITRVTVPRPASGAWTGTTISGGLMAATDYEVRTTITTFPARLVTYNAWLAITTGGTHVIASAGSLYDTATDEAFSAAEAINSVWQQLYRITTEADLSGATIDRQVRETEATRASFTQVIELVATEAEARATAITGVQAQVDDVSAGGFYRLQASVGALPGDVSSEFVVALNAGTEGSPDWQEAGFALQILSGGAGSRAVFNVDQLLITDGTTVTALFEPGTLFVKDAVIPNLTTDKITGLDAYFVGELEAATIKTSQLEADSILIGGVLLDPNAVTPLRETTLSGNIEVFYNGVATNSALFSDINIPKVVIDASTYETLQTYTATELLVNRPYWVHFEYENTVVNSPFYAFVMYRYGTSGDWTFVNFALVNGSLTSGERKRILLNIGMSDAETLYFRVNATKPDNSLANPILTNCRIVVNQIDR
jgi:hypothetical protein